MAVAEERGGVSYVPTPEEELAAYQAQQYAQGNAYSTGTADVNYYAYGGAGDPMGQVAPPAGSGYMDAAQTQQYYAAPPPEAVYSTAPAPAPAPGGWNWDGPQPGAPPPPPPPSAQSQQVGSFLSWLQGGGMPTSGGGGVSPVAAPPMIGARPGDVVDTDSDGRIDAPMPLPNTTWGGMMDSQLPPAAAPPPFDPNMVPGAARNVGGRPDVNGSVVGGQSWDGSSGYYAVENNRAGFRYPDGGSPAMPVSGPADAGQRWAPPPGPLTVPWQVSPGNPERVIWPAIEALNNPPPAAPPPGPPPGPAPAPVGAAPAPAPAMAPAAPAQGTPLITPTGEVYGTLTTNAQGQTVVKKLPKGAPNRWNIPQLPTTDLRGRMIADGMAGQALPPGITQTVAPGFPLPPGFLPPEWAEQAGPAMPQLPRNRDDRQGGGGRNRDRR